jgi:4-amino-4-deoxy-L-arabinose transferase-like glycosyltransferase
MSARATRLGAAFAAALRRVPRAAWACALIATLSAACWSLITPPFQAPDEPSHFAYVQLLAETARLPSSRSIVFSPEEEAVLRDLNQREVRWHPEVKTISSPSARRRLRADLARPLSRVGSGGAGVAASEPPLYYALETIPYALGASGSLLDRLELMRLLSALMAGVTALFVYLFVREALPGARWAWIVGGLGAALTPLLGFTSGVVTPDAMLTAVSAAIFYCLVRAFRRGLTRTLAVVIGALTAAGLLTKVNFVGLAPGVMLGLVILGFRAWRSAGGGRGSWRALGPMALALALAVSPVFLYVLDNLVNHHPALGLVSTAVRDVSGHESLLGELSYDWQLYLPRLPGMVNYFPGLSTTREVWFDRSVGLFGWLDTAFPDWVYRLALIPAGLIALLALRSLIARRAALRSRLPELLVYLVMSVGLMLLIGGDSRLHRLKEGAGYAQPRYLLPLLPLAACALVLAARGAGRRWGAAAGALIVVLFLAQDIFSQLLVVARFYG